MCRPSFYGIQYEINPWMKVTVQANQKLAVEQWTSLCDRIREHNGEIRFIKEQPGLPDMVFTANGGTVIDKEKKIVAIANYHHPERKGEEEWFVQWFSDENWSFFYPSVSYEGAGDALMLNNTLICGTGFRSVAAAHQEVKAACNVDKTLTVKLVDNYFYHLDTCFCPLNDGDYLIYPDAFDPESYAAIEQVQKDAKKGTRIDVPVDEARKFACNAVCIDKAVILPEGCPITMHMLERAGYKSVPTNMSEFIKAGGACKCLTLEIG